MAHRLRSFKRSDMYYFKTLYQDPEFLKKFDLMDPDDDELYVYLTTLDNKPLEIRIAWSWFIDLGEGAWGIEYLYDRELSPTYMVWAILPELEPYRMPDYREYIHDWNPSYTNIGGG
jgi:hypothetical protein